jgi:Outer membrane protein beta-barrel domain
MIMKKKILFSIGLFVSVTSFAQQIHYGVSGGITAYNMRGASTSNLEQVLSFTNGVVSTGPVRGFYGGGYTNIPVGNILSVEPGLYYSLKGYSITSSYSINGIGLLSANATASLRSSYIEMPILLKADFSGLQIFAGPQISYLTNSSIRSGVGLAGINLLHSNFDVTSQLNRWDAGITGGVGYQFTNGIRITGSYERELAKVDAGQNIKSYNQGFKIGAGFNF